MGEVSTATVSLDAGATAGAYSAVPSGLVMNAATGAMNIAASAAGVYTVTNFVAASGGLSIGECNDERPTIGTLLMADAGADISICSGETASTNCKRDWNVLCLG
ncbi:MAG: hypothetical protein IPL33_21080 [Sphingobacteriales bacterium]|nr:hypothetical protein [Sphingobacteriales bacterium]